MGRCRRDSAPVLATLCVAIASGGCATAWVPMLSRVTTADGAGLCGHHRCRGLRFYPVLMNCLDQLRSVDRQRGVVIKPKTTPRKPYRKERLSLAEADAHRT